MSSSLRKPLIIVSLIAIIGIAIAGLFLTQHTQKPAVVTKTGCVTQNLAVGSNSSCVLYAKTMVDYIETAGLNECSFTGGQVVPLNNDYDTATAQQIKVVQTWINCYNKQEGSTQTIAENGSVNSTTWMVLCSYGFSFPKQSHSTTSPYHYQTISAGQDAGCETE